MTLIVAGMLSGDFKKGVNDAAVQRVLWHLREQQDNMKKTNPAQQQEQSSDAAPDFALSVISVEQATQFQAELDLFQEVTVEALDRSRLQMEEARERLDRIMEQAHVLEDGRRVFKTQDGLKVFDEHGMEVAPEEILPEEIADYLPRWESVKEAIDAFERLEQEQSELLDFQARLDAAKDRLDTGTLTQAEYDDLRKDLFDSAPQAVRDLAHERDLALEDAPATAEPPKPSDIAINLDDELASLPKPTNGAPGLGL